LQSYLTILKNINLVFIKFNIWEVPLPNAGTIWGSGTSEDCRVTPPAIASHQALRTGRRLAPPDVSVGTGRNDNSKLLFTKIKLLLLRKT